MKKIKKILFIGNFSIDYCTEVHHKKTFEKLGIEVIAVQENKTNYEEIFNKLISDDIDMIYHTHTHGWEIDRIEDIYKLAKKMNIPTVGYHLDLWKGIQREADLETDPYWNIEYFFTVDKLFVADLEKKGIKAHYLPAGVFEDEAIIIK